MDEYMTRHRRLRGFCHRGIERIKLRCNLQHITYHHSLGENLQATLPSWLRIDALFRLSEICDKTTTTFSVLFSAVFNPYRAHRFKISLG
jgi:hypothetical protein